MKRLNLTLRRPSIRTGLIAAIGGLAAVSGVMAAASVTSMTSMDRRFELIAGTAMAGISMSKDIDLAAVKLREAYGQHLLAADKPAKADIEKKIATINNGLQATLKSYAELLGESGDKAKLGELDTQLTAYNKMGKTLLFYSSQGKDQNARMYLGTMTGIGNTLAKITAEIVAQSEGNAAAGREASRATTAQMILIAELLAAFAGLVALGSGIFVVRGIGMPIGRITKAMRRLADGDVTSTIPFAGRGDEVGAMAGAVEVFRQAAISNLELEREAEEARGRAAAERAQAEREAEEHAAERLRVATSGLAAALERLAGGDLGFQIEKAFASEFEPLRHDFNRSVRQLSETLAEISNTVGAVESGSHEIASGANDLSRRTEQQAAALEETAAALDEITSNVSHAAKRTEEAKSLAGRANQSAAQSGRVVADAEEAMRRIEQSSQQISSIIGVIDEIAFQTNLLALNAGVEAARAGDAGKGFAVVAQEVRELAGRSAGAAKEIKALIKNSATEVNAGVKLVRETGAALGEIGGFIVEINGHMEAIAVSAKEQSTGLAEVNGAVNQMDQTTQQNAAMVEESTAASAALAGEAQTLRALISKFSFGDMPVSAKPSAMLRQTAAAMAAPVSPAARRADPRPSAAPMRAARAGAAAAPAAQGAWEEF
jgi:methyl-accepting chemotaxis protein